MSKIQRYEHGDKCGDEYLCRERKADDGEFVYYEDYQKEIARLTAEKQKAVKQSLDLVEMCRDYSEKIDRLTVENERLKEKGGE